MAERTKRGQEDRKREDDKMQGEPLDTNRGGQTGNTTRDQGVEPTDDIEDDEDDDEDEDEDEEES